MYFKNTALALLLCISLSADDTVETGMKIEEVRNILGSEQGVLDLPNKKILVYPRGKVSFKDGIVSNVELMSEEEFQKKTEADKKRKEAFAKKKAEEAKEKLALGKSIRDDKLMDPDFLSQSLEMQILYWRNFISRYPEVSVEPEFSELISKFKEEQDSERALQAKLREKQLLRAEEEKLKEAESRSYFRYSTYRPNINFGNCGSYQRPIIIRSQQRQPILKVNYQSNSTSVRYSSNGQLGIKILN